ATLERGPARAVPPPDATRRHAARARHEGATGIERRPAAVVVRDEGTHGCAGAEVVAESRPARPVPLRDPTCRHAARAGEGSADEERGTVPIVVRPQRLDGLVHTAAE